LDKANDILQQHDFSVSCIGVFRNGSSVLDDLFDGVPDQHLGVFLQLEFRVQWLGSPLPEEQFPDVVVFGEDGNGIRLSLALVPVNRFLVEIQRPEKKSPRLTEGTISTKWAPGNADLST
jgi:hypothetical protein